MRCSEDRDGAADEQAPELAAAGEAAAAVGTAAGVEDGDCADADADAERGGCG